MMTDVTHQPGTFLETADLPLPERQPDGITPSQTVGPFFHYALTPDDYAFAAVFSPDLTTPDVLGERITISGHVFDGTGAAVPDAMLEIWQADATGRYVGKAERAASNAGFTGFGRCPTAQDGSYSFATIRPGSVAIVNGGMQAPHISLHVFARGMLRHLHTRIYFADQLANADDGVLALVDAGRRSTLMASPDGPGRYRFDIRLHGDNETVFFTV